MTGGFDVDPDVIDRASAAMGDAADQFDSALTQFVSTLSGVGDPWGQDTLGTLIGGGYVAVEQLAVETWSSVVDGLDEFADGLESMAGQYRSNEAATVVDINKSGEV